MNVFMLYYDSSTILDLCEVNMSTARSARAQRRASRVRNQRIMIIVIVVAVIAAILFLVFSRRSTPTVSNPSELVTSDSGLQYQDLVIGSGPQAEKGDIVSVHYTGWLEDGTKFDSSLDRGEPYQLTLGAGGVIPGWEEGLLGMQEGGKRKLIIPPDLGYGESGFAGVIPANATLIFEVELVDIR
jgi:peptidylprolyl isomerase